MATSVAKLLALLQVVLHSAMVLTSVPPPSSNGTVTNASQILQRIPLKQLRLIAPESPVYSGSKAAITLVRGALYLPRRTRMASSLSRARSSCSPKPAPTMPAGSRQSFPSRRCSPAP